MRSTVAIVVASVANRAVEAVIAKVSSCPASSMNFLNLTSYDVKFGTVESYNEHALGNGP